MYSNAEIAAMREWLRTNHPEAEQNAADWMQVLAAIERLYPGHIQQFTIDHARDDRALEPE